MQSNISQDNSKNLWQLLWEYDPNGLVVFDADRIVKVTNPAFSHIFSFTQHNFIGQKLDSIFSDTSDFQKIIESDEEQIISEQYSADFDRYVRYVLFKVESENLYASIIIDQTEKWKRDNQLHEIQEEAVKRLNELTTKQMLAAQSIASLLGETTAETKVNVLKLQHLLENDNGLH